MFLFIYFLWKSTGGEWLFNGLAEIDVSRGEKTSSLILAVINALALIHMDLKD